MCLLFTCLVLSRLSLQFIVVISVPQLHVPIGILVAVFVLTFALVFSQGSVCKAPRVSSFCSDLLLECVDDGKEISTQLPPAWHLLCLPS